MASKNPGDSMNFLYDIMNDLYGSLGQNGGVLGADRKKSTEALQR